MPPAPKFSELIPMSKIDIEDSDVEEVSLDDMQRSIKVSNGFMQEKKLITGGFEIDNRFTSKGRGSM